MHIKYDSAALTKNDHELSHPAMHNVITLTDRIVMNYYQLQIITPMNKHKKLLLSTPFALILMSASTFDPISSTLFFVGLICGGVLLLHLLYLVFAWQYKRMLFDVVALLAFVLLFPQDSIAPTLIQIRMKTMVALNSEMYRKEAEKKILPDGSAVWAIGHQNLTEYRLIFTPDRLKIEAAGAGDDYDNCRTTTRIVNKEFGLLTITCI